MSKRAPVSICMDTTVLSNIAGKVAKKCQPYPVDKSDILNIMAAEVIGQNQNWGALLHKDGPVTALGMKKERTAPALDSPSGTASLSNLDVRLYVDVRNLFMRQMVEGDLKKYTLVEFRGNLVRRSGSITIAENQTREWLKQNLEAIKATSTPEELEDKVYEAAKKDAHRVLLKAFKEAIPADQLTPASDLVPELNSRASARHGRDGSPFLQLGAFRGNDTESERFFEIPLKSWNEKISKISKALDGRTDMPRGVVFVDGNSDATVTFFIGVKELAACVQDEFGARIDFPNLSEASLREAIKHYEHYEDHADQTEVFTSQGYENTKLNFHSPYGTKLTFTLSGAHVMEMMDALSNPDENKVVDAGLVKVIFTPKGITGISWDEDTTLVFPNINKEELAFSLGQLGTTPVESKPKARFAREIAWSKVFETFLDLWRSSPELDEHLSWNARTSDEVSVAVFHATQKWMKDNAAALEAKKDGDPEWPEWAGSPISWDLFAKAPALPQDIEEQLDENFIANKYDEYLIERLDVAYKSFSVRPDA